MIRQPVQYHSFSIPKPNILNITIYYPIHSGHATTASALSWILYSFAKHPAHHYLLSYIFRACYDSQCTIMDSLFLSQTSWTSLFIILYIQVIKQQPVQYQGYSIPLPNILNITIVYPIYSGHDTTASAISWILYSLAKHPEHNYLLSCICRSWLDSQCNIMDTLFLSQTSWI